MVKLWNISKSWDSPQVFITVEGFVETVSLTEIMKEWKTFSEMVTDLAVNISEGFFVYVNDKEVEQETAKDIQLSNIRKLVITTEKISTLKSVPKSVPKTLLDKLEKEKEDVEENPVSKKTENKQKTKHHVHGGIIGYHKRTDLHKNPVAKQAHDKSIEEEK